MKKIFADLNAVPRLLLAVFLCCVGGYFMGLIYPLIPEDKSIVPITFMALLASPITIAITSMVKIGDVNKGAGLSNSERRRIIPALQARRQSLQLMVFIYTVLSIFTGVFLFISTLPAGRDFAIWIYRGVGASVAFAAATSYFMLTDLGKLSDFEALIAKRTEERKKKTAILKKMKRSSSH